MKRINDMPQASELLEKMFQQRLQPRQLDPTTDDEGQEEEVSICSVSALLSRDLRCRNISALVALVVSSPTM